MCKQASLFYGQEIFLESGGMCRKAASFMKFSVKIKSDYGYGCGGCAYGSEDELCYEVDDVLGAYLKREIQSHEGELTRDDVRELIDDGHTELEDLDDDLFRKCVMMDLKYWCDTASDECTCDYIDDMIDAMIGDIEEERFTPELTFEQFLEDEGYDTDDENYCEEDARDEYNSRILDDEYLSWAKSTLDIFDFAELVGVDVYSVYEECNGDYVIQCED